MDEDKDQEVKVSPVLIEIGVAVAAFLIVLAVLGAYLGGLYDWYRNFLERVYAIWIVIHLEVAIFIILMNAVLVAFLVRSYRHFLELKHTPPLFLLPGNKPVDVAPTSLYREVGAEWREIEKLAESANASEWNMAILRADALLDDALQHMKQEGTTVKERLDHMDPTQMPSRERAYSAHRLRNMIAHDPTISHTKETIAHGLASYKIVFQELGILKKEETQDGAVNIPSEVLSER